MNLLGHALRKAVGLAAQELGTSAEAVVEAAGLSLMGHSSLKAALDLDWGEPSARARALGVVLEEVARWQHWLEQQQPLAAEQPPLKEVMETIMQIITQDTEPDPGGGPGARRLKQHVAADPRISIEDTDMRHGRKSSAKTFNGFKEHFAVDLDSKVIREVVVRPANEPEHEAVDLLAEELENARAAPAGYRPGLHGPGLPNGKRRACTLSRALGRKWVHCSRKRISLWTLRVCTSPVQVARASRWSRHACPVSCGAV